MAKAAANGEVRTGLFRARVAAGLSQQKLAELANTTKQTVSRLEKSDMELTRAWAERFAPFVHRSAREIIFDDEEPQTLVPVLSWVSAGQLSDATSQIPIQDVPLLAFSDLGPGDFFALEVHGDSMDRVSPDGSKIVVNRAQKTLLPGRPYVFSVRGEATYKIWRPEPVPRLSPYSTNPTNEPIFVEDQEELNVIGRVRRTLLDL